MARLGRNTLITDFIAAVIAETDDTTYPNVADLTAANIKYGITKAKQIRSLILANNKLVLVGLGPTKFNTQFGGGAVATLGGHQFPYQTVWVETFILGVDTTNDQKLAVTVAEELEEWIYNNKTPSTGWRLVGHPETEPDMWGEGASHVIRDYYMEMVYRKFGAMGVP